MARRVDVTPFEVLLELPRETTELWVTPAVRARVTEVICIGGGTLLDIAKAWRADRSPAIRLIAVPSVWGSGAEVSPIVVLNDGGKKMIRMDDRFLPDEVVYWPELAQGLPERVARAGCGDCNGKTGQ